MEAKGRIAIADDEETFCESTADLLREQGFECITFPDAYAAVGTLQKNSYDLLIADIRMPGNGNLELIQNLPSTVPDLQVIIVTGFPTMATAIQSVKLPVIAYLLKPVEFSELLGYIESGVQHRRILDIHRKMQSRISPWSSEIEELLQFNTPFPKQLGTVSIENFLQFSLQNIIANLIEYKSLTDAYRGQTEPESVCKVLNCPTQSVYREAIRETIDVLEKTKGSFKSKDLAALRKRLETIYRAETKR